MLGTPREDPSWGPNIWVEPAGHAVADAEHVRDLYASAAARWVEEGRTSHYAIVPAADERSIDAWFRLGFGQQHVYAIRETPPATPLTEAAAGGIEIRRPTRDDTRRARASSSVALPAHQARSPVFSRSRAAAGRGGARRVGGGLRRPEVRHVRRRASTGGSSARRSAARSSVVRHAQGPRAARHAGFLGFAAVLPEARGARRGRALGDDGARLGGRDEGYPSSSPTGGRRTCCRRAPGRSSGSGRRSSASSARSPDAVAPAA